MNLQLKYARHDVFRPVRDDGAHARTRSQRTMPFINPAARVTAVHEELALCLDQVYMARINNESDTLFSQMQSTPFRLQSAFIMLTIAVRMNLDMLDKAVCQRPDAQQINLLKAMSAQLQTLSKAMCHSQEMITFERLNDAGLSVHPSTEPTQCKLAWLALVFRDMCTLYSQGLGTLGLSEATDTPALNRLRTVCDDLMVRNFYRLLTCINQVDTEDKGLVLVDAFSSNPPPVSV